MENSKIKNASFKTLEGRMTVILYIACDTKKYDLYKKFSIMMLDLLFSLKQDEEEQILNEKEEEIHIPIEVVINVQKRLLEQYVKSQLKRIMKIHY